MKEPPAHYHGSLIEWKALSPQSRQRVHHPDKDKAYNKNNKEVIKIKKKAYLEKNHEAIKTKKKAYYQLNCDKKLEQQRNYRMKKANDFYELFGTWEIEPGIY